MLPLPFSCLSVTTYNFTRINKNDTVLLIVDHQEGLFQLVRDFQPDQYRRAVLAHASIGKIFNLPVIMTSSSDTGPNGPLMKEITDMYPDAPFIRRLGEVDAWDNPDFQAAVRATGKSQVIMAGITTDVCTTFLALSLVQDGFTVFANADASGTFDLRTAQDANDRMRDAGVNVLSMFAINTDLMRDWRDTPGALEELPYYDQYLTSYGMLTRTHRAAILNGTILPGEDI
ncbi:Isochorismatase hydrolase [Stereum hirsutum FP-91666 SS1]|uniref:Isochorismatase hydrolase n=1 Tax=Stereum hirsutum (strain FP-91666) TaxID=721885 RepID=UPI000440E3BF|nr:Isochorismatase hydrolase [Stereum hirsutum FP-91666 SS1]EIM91437.1 Isochorismatase hydrolase [Stereum hirsutum FP-91666 SS1]